MKCIIIEDQPPAQRLLKKYVGDLEELELLGCFSEATQALELIRSGEVELLFLDIHLPKLSGVEFLRSLPNPPKVIFTTAFSEYALDGFDLDVADYLLKPFSFERFVKAVTKAAQIKRKAPGSPPKEKKKEIFIKSGYEYIRLRVEEIRYIKSDSDYTEIHLLNRRLLSSEPLHHWLKVLDDQQFAQVHKSFLVNTAQIEKVVGSEIFLQDGSKVPIGRAFKGSFWDRFIQGGK